MLLASSTAHSGDIILCHKNLPFLLLCLDTPIGYLNCDKVYTPWGYLSSIYFIIFRVSRARDLFHGASRLRLFVRLIDGRLRASPRHLAPLSVCGACSLAYSAPNSLRATLNVKQASARLPRSSVLIYDTHILNIRN